MQAEEIKTSDSKNCPVSNSSTDNWLTFQTEFEDITSSIRIKKGFYDEMKSFHKRMRVNKKIPKKSHLQPQNSNEGFDSPLGSPKDEDYVFQTAIPNTITYTYQGLGSRLYNCNFTNDGKNVVVTSQTGTSFFSFSENNNISLSKVIYCQSINWAITDTDISSDSKFMVHSTLSPSIHMVDIVNSKYAGKFNIKTGDAESISNDMIDDYWYPNFRVFSLKLSGNNKEVIAGCGRIGQHAPIQVYDLHENKLKQSISAHKEDINSVCYVDKENSSIFISGSDDGKCKLWDTRILKNNQPVGIFYGHLAGLTFVTSKGDNRYFISNSKDQTIKLWDLRKAVTEEKNALFLPYDYRYSRPSYQSLEHIRNLQKKNESPDQSILTFQGHKVAGTLIRCHFSPSYGTGQRYIYSGSYDGKIYIFDTVSGENIACLGLPGISSIVRDCAWHPYSQNIISTCFKGEIHRWEYMDLRDSEMILDDDENDSERGQQQRALGLNALLPYFSVNQNAFEYDESSGDDIEFYYEEVEEEEREEGEEEEEGDDNDSEQSY